METNFLCRIIQDDVNYSEEERRDAMNTLVNENSQLVYHIANRLKSKVLHTTYDYEDMIQDGLIGMMKAAKKYDPSQGTLSNYASWWIESSIRYESAKRFGNCHIPKNVYDSIMGNAECSDEKRKDQAIAVAQMNDIDDVHSIDPDTEDEILIRDIVSDELEWDDSVLSSIITNFMIDDFRKFMNESLTELELQVLNLRFSQDLTLIEVGEIINKSRERVRDIELRSLRKLRMKIGTSSPELKKYWSN